MALQMPMYEMQLRMDILQEKVALCLAFLLWPNLN